MLLAALHAGWQCAAWWALGLCGPACCCWLRNLCSLLPAWSPRFKWCLAPAAALLYPAVSAHLRSHSRCSDLLLISQYSWSSKACHKHDHHLWCTSPCTSNCQPLAQAHASRSSSRVSTLATNAHCIQLALSCMGFPPCCLLFCLLFSLLLMCRCCQACWCSCC